MNTWTTSVLPVVTLILGGGLAFWQQSHSRREQQHFEDARRWHDSKREAYARLLSACRAQTDSLYDALLSPEVLKHDSSESLGQGWGAILAANEALLSAFGEVRILGSPAVVMHADRLIRALDMISDEMGGFTDGDGHTDHHFLDHVDHTKLRVEALGRIESNMLSEMRADLGTSLLGRNPALHEPWWPWFNETQYSGPTHGCSD